MEVTVLSINGVAEAVADGVMEARRTVFLSVEDFKSGEGIGVAAVEQLKG